MKITLKIQKTNESYQKLQASLCDAILEQQVKLGYEKETVYLYYPLSSIMHYFKLQEKTAEQLDEVLEGFHKFVKNKLGDVKVTREGNRYCFAIPAEGSAYVHKFLFAHPFLTKLVERVKEPCEMEDILAIFKEYSPNIMCEKFKDEDFDFVVHFEDKKIDKYYYCFKKEAGQMTYHRFNRHDYKDVISR